MRHRPRGQRKSEVERPRYLETGSILRDESRKRPTQHFGSVDRANDRRKILFFFSFSLPAPLLCFQVSQSFYKPSKARSRRTRGSSVSKSLPPDRRASSFVTSSFGSLIRYRFSIPINRIPRNPRGPSNTQQPFPAIKLLPISSCLMDPDRDATVHSMFSWSLVNGTLGALVC